MAEEHKGMTLKQMAARLEQAGYKVKRPVMLEGEAVGRINAMLTRNNGLAVVVRKPGAKRTFVLTLEQYGKLVESARKLGASGMGNKAQLGGASVVTAGAAS